MESLAERCTCDLAPSDQILRSILRRDLSFGLCLGAPRNIPLLDVRADRADGSPLLERS
jgi:hypothetical protein